MRWWIGVALAIWGSTALAQECSEIVDDAERLACYDDAATAECKVGDWRYYRQVPGVLGIEGVSNCRSGRLDFQLYEGDEFLAAHTTFISGFGFKTFVDVPGFPPNLGMRYVIDPE